MKTLHVGIASYQEMKARTIAIARCEIKPSAHDPKVWFTSAESFARVLSDKNRALLEMIAQLHPESITELLRSHSELDLALEYLDSREKEIIEMRFGLDNKQPNSLEKVGSLLKISRERVRQLEERAIRRLKSIALRMKLIEFETTA